MAMTVGAETGLYKKVLNNEVDKEHLPIGDFELLKSGKDKDSCFTHTRFGLADNVHTSDGLGDAFVLNLNRFY